MRHVAIFAFLVLLAPAQGALAQGALLGKHDTDKQIDIEAQTNEYDDKAKTVSFGATDAPLTGKDLEESGLVQFPAVMGGIVPVVNLDGIKPGELVLDGPTLAKIFLTEIKSWDDPAIQKLNIDNPRLARVLRRSVARPLGASVGEDDRGQMSQKPTQRDECPARDCRSLRKQLPERHCLFNAERAGARPL